MIPYCSFSALMSRNLPLSVLQFHLPLCYLGSGALSSLKGAVWSWDLDLAISCEEVICSSCLGHWVADLTAYGLRCDGSLGDLRFCGPVICLVKFLVIMCLPCHLQVKRRTTEDLVKETIMHFCITSFFFWVVDSYSLGTLSSMYSWG